jgi:hypothetical protein
VISPQHFSLRPHLICFHLAHQRSSKALFKADSDKVVLLRCNHKKIISASWLHVIKYTFHWEWRWYEVIMTCRGTLFRMHAIWGSPFNGNILFTHSYREKWFLLLFSRIHLLGKCV